MKENQSPPSSETKKLRTSSKGLVYHPSNNLGHPNPPGFVIYHLFKLRVNSLDPYRVYSVFLCIGLSYLAWVLVFYTILTLGLLLWPRLLTLTTQYHLGSISWVWVLYLTLILNWIWLQAIQGTQTFGSDSRSP